VFVALKGEHFDGNDYAEQALKDGAEYVIKGENALAELQDLARAWRRQWGKQILAITGTNGKTTTKELTAAVLRTKYNVLYTEGNYNNSLGVPLTLLRLTKEHDFAIVEMGASHPGDIKELVDVAEPDFGLITNVGRAHLQGFGSFEGVMRTKGELYDYIAEHHGTIFRNEDNPYLREMLELAEKNVNCQLSIVNYHASPMLSGTHLVGDYNSENIQAALCVGEYFGISRKDGEAAVRAYVPTNNRSQAMKTEHNDLVIDAYNANPTSMQAAINAFSNSSKNGLTAVGGLTSDSEAVYILGSMRELGDYTKLEHQNIANMLLERKADTVFLVGNEWKETTAPYPVFENVEALADYILKHPLDHCRILVKGSRSNQLEKIIPYL
jgi:UDP-N-acetylmuramoyl-tripeptide--D-alanyl-D-alanine ligase